MKCGTLTFTKCGVTSWLGDERTFRLIKYWTLYSQDASAVIVVIYRALV